MSGQIGIAPAISLGYTKKCEKEDREYPIGK